MNNLIFIYGEDNYRSYQTLKEIKLRFIQKNTDFNLVELQGKEISPKILESQISSVPLFSDKRMIIVRNLYLSKNKFIQEILGILPSLPESTLLVIYESGLPDQRLSIFKNLIKIANVKKIDRLNETQLQTFINDYLRSQNATIEPDAMQLLGVNFGEDLWALTNELDKLITYNSKITVENINLLSLTAQNTIIFKLIDQIVAGETYQVLSTLDALRRQGEENLLILGLITSTFRNLATIYLAQKNGLAKFNLAKVLKIHPFVVAKSSEILVKLNLTSLVVIYENLVSIDSSIKTGKIDSEAGLDLLVVKLSKLCYPK